MNLTVVLVAAVLCGVTSGRILSLGCLKCEGIEGSECQRGFAEDFQYCGNKTYPGHCVSYWFMKNGIDTVGRGCEYHTFGKDVCDTLKQNKGARGCISCVSENFCNQLPL